MVGVVDELLVPTFPAEVELTVLVSVTPDKPGRTYAIGMVLPGGEPGKGKRVPLPIGLGGRAVTTAIDLPLFTVERPGEMTWMLLCERVMLVRESPG